MDIDGHLLYNNCINMYNSKYPKQFVVERFTLLLPLNM